MVPGWATDYQIFDTLDLKYNYVVPVDFNPDDFKDTLSEFLETSSIGLVSLFGWSQGGFMAVDFASHNTRKVGGLILAGIRKRYDQSALEGIRRKLERNKRAFLYKFYLDCFSPDDNEGRNWFKRRLLKKYLDRMGLEYLVRGLDYLSGAQINIGSLSGVKKIRIFHGGQDKIAPLDEALEIKSLLPQADFIYMERAGHALFLNPDFKERFDG